MKWKSNEKTKKIEYIFCYLFHNLKTFTIFAPWKKVFARNAGPIFLKRRGFEGGERVLTKALEVCKTTSKREV